MIKVVVLGAGNVATHLTTVFLKNEHIDLVQVYNRTLNSIAYLKEKVAITNKISELKDADIYIIAVSDNGIAPLSKKLIFKDKLVVHTSGSVAMKNLKCTAHKGVFYPLQTFSKDKEISFKNIPICIETEEKSDIILLENLADLISEKVYHINSEQRKQLHVAAVFVNNFVNHLYFIGEEICQQKNVPFEILQPLIEETATKIKTLSAYYAQTGPAIRQDTKTIDSQLKMLSSEQQKIYKILTDSIQKTYHEKL